jgi:hypothetical protein
LPASSPRWTEVDGSISFSRKRLFNLSMLGVEARYVKLSFQVEKAGRIAALGLYGGETLERFALRQEQNHQQMTWLSNSAGGRTKNLEDQLNFNFANLYAKAQVVHVSSGAMPAAQRMIDDDNETGFRFAKTDPHPTVIVELAESERLNRVSALYKMNAAGRLDIFLLNDLSRDAMDLTNQTPVASVSDTDGDGKAAVDFDPRGTQYVALRWTPAEGANADRAFEIAEINAFGNVPLAMLTLNAAPDLYAASWSPLQSTGGGSPTSATASARSQFRRRSRSSARNGGTAAVPSESRLEHAGRSPLLLHKRHDCGRERLPRPKKIIEPRDGDLQQPLTEIALPFPDRQQTAARIPVVRLRRAARLRSLVLLDADEDEKRSISLLEFINAEAQRQNFCVY